MNVDKRVVLVTGGASGIGRATVDRLAQANVHVVVADVQVLSLIHISEPTRPY